MASTIRGSRASILARKTAFLPPNPSSSRTFSSSSVRAGYDDTVQNLKIGKHTRVMYQGFTGRVATGNAKDSIAYGTNIVGGVTPGKEGEHIGLPLYPTVQKAKDELKPDATAVFVAAQQCAKAIEEAIAAEIPLIVSVAEHIPIHDLLRVSQVLKTQSKSRLVGANAPGIIGPIGFCRIGFQPLPTFAPGHVGIAAKSGTLSYEAVASITRSGLGQSLCIGMGGDVVAGTNLVDALRVFEKDDETEAIVLIGEVGGRAEEDAADWIRDYLKREKNPKPIAALVGGKCARPNTIMGHAGAWAARGERDSHQKYSYLQEAGATMVDHPEMFGGVMKTLLEQAGKDVNKIQASANQTQKRGYHTLRRSPAMQRASRRPTTATMQVQSSQQQRGLHIGPELASVPLYPYLSKISGLALSLDEAPKDGYYVGVIIDRTERCPCIVVAPTGDSSQIDSRVKRIPYDYATGPTDSQIQEAISHLQFPSSQPAQQQVRQLISSLSKMYKEKEAVILTGVVSIGGSGNIKLHQPSLSLMFDDAAFRSSKRQEDVHRLRQKDQEVPEEVEAEKDGIVYVKLDDPEASIGTLVNGAGLAMNTVDALLLHGGRATNFLDTGGKATSETVKKSFELILQDPRVKVIFVNIFGGLTDGGMIADGIMLAFKEVDMKNVPVVVRIRGTNEELGQKKIAESGLGLDAYDKFEDAAKAVIEIANR